MVGNGVTQRVQTRKNVGMLVSAFVLASGVSAGTAGCSRDHIEAVNLANAGDQAVKVNVRGAVAKYEEATRLDPTNHHIFWKLAMAYQKQEEWSKMESTLSRASSVAPTNADYYYYRGYALIKIAEASKNKEAYAEAKGPLQKCIEVDANFAECYYWLGQAEQWTEEEQSALENYTKAIEHDPTVGYFYPPLAEMYLNLKMYNEAEQVLKEGEQHLEKVVKNKNALYGIYTLMFNVYQAHKDLAGGAAALEKANDVAGDTHPEIAFNLGSTYAVMKPPKKDQAVRLLKSFNKRACKSKDAIKFKQQCETSNALVAKLGGE
jgi:tetratricopeptide (TPR) repeat protein